MLEQWDKSVTLLLNGSDSLYLDGVMWTVTHTITWIPLFLALLYLLIKHNETRRFFIILGAIALLILVTDQFSSSFCKPFFQRLRPSQDPTLKDLVDIVNSYRGGKYGFISSHAANTFGLATFLTLLFKMRHTSALLYAWAFLCSYSRVYLGVHFFGDILCGAIFGFLAGSFVYYLMIVILQRHMPQRCSSLSTFTKTVYLADDSRVLELVFLTNLLYIFIRAAFYTSVF